MNSSPHTHIKPIFFPLREINLLFLFLARKGVVPNDKKVGYIFTKKKWVTQKIMKFSSLLWNCLVMFRREDSALHGFLFRREKSL